MLRSRKKSSARTDPRLALIATLTVAMLAAAPAHAASHKPSKRRSRTSQLEQIYRQRAIDSYAAMQRAYYVPSAGLYRGSPYADAWSYSQAMAATISVAALPQMHRQYRGDLVARLQGLHDYADLNDAQPAGYESVVTAPIGPGGDRFNDDNNWIGIELLRLYHIDHNPSLLGAADQIFQMVVSQWQADASQPCPGGAPWRSFVATSQRNTVTNATGAELGAQLYMTRRSASDLMWAQRMYDWVRSCLQNPDGLYGDNITAGGVDSTEWTYNQGTMIGAGVMLYQATANRAYLQQALATGHAALHTYDASMLATQGDGFNAIYIRNLLLLGGASGDPAFASFARWYANDAWRNVRDPKTNLYLSGPGGDTNLLDQAAMTQVNALLAEPAAAYF
jgi:Glycosyl hydrolase family 76